MVTCLPDASAAGMFDDRQSQNGRHSETARLTRFFAGDFRALFARFREANRDGLLAALHAAAFTGLSGSQRAFFPAAHRAPDGFLCRSSVSWHSFLLN